MMTARKNGRLFSWKAAMPCFVVLLFFFVFASSTPRAFVQDGVVYTIIAKADDAGAIDPSGPVMVGLEAIRSSPFHQTRRRALNTRKHCG
ncbi:MAG: hypothetical protein GY859_39375 [Desulfobacterales bacterium]|nr:hypothetical protein [Desulfobacterales bacterium]